jgi:hypothetical protein
MGRLEIHLAQPVTNVARTVRRLAARWAKGVAIFCALSLQAGVCSAAEAAPHGPPNLDVKHPSLKMVGCGFSGEPACSSPNAQDSTPRNPVSPPADAEALMKVVRYKDALWQLAITSRADSLTIKNVVANRGNCKPLGLIPRYPQNLRFGQQFSTGVYDCAPIEVYVFTDQGNAIFKWDVPESNADAFVSTRKEWREGLGLWILRPVGPTA